MTIGSALRQLELVMLRQLHRVNTIGHYVGTLGSQALIFSSSKRACNLFTMERICSLLANQSFGMQQKVRNVEGQPVVLLPFPTLMPPSGLFLDASEGEAAVNAAKDSESSAASYVAISEQ